MRPERPYPLSQSRRDGVEDETSQIAVRVLLGMPVNEGSDRPVVARSTPTARFTFSLLADLDERVREARLDEELIEEMDSGSADATDPTPHGATEPQASSPKRSLHELVSASTSSQNNEKSSSVGSDLQQTTPRERTSIEIPGVSTRKHDVPVSSPPEDSRESVQKKTPHEESGEPLQPVTASGRYPREADARDAELLTRLERFVAEAETIRQSETQMTGEPNQTAPQSIFSVHSREVRPLSPAFLPANLPGQRNGADLEHTNRKMAEQLRQLQRTVHELTVLVSSLSAQHTDGGQPPRREQTTLQSVHHTTIIKQSRSPFGTTRAFWERSRLSRVHLRTGR